MSFILRIASTGWALLLFLASSLNAEDEGRNWSQFRGAHGDGVSAAGDLPVNFDEAHNVRWKTAIPGEGWSSPVVWDSEIWLTTGSEPEDRRQSLGTSRPESLSTGAAGIITDH